MNDKEKQIEEIQKALPHIEVIKAMYSDIDFAKYLYDRDIRKIPEDSVVQSKEEYAKILKAYVELKRENRDKYSFEVLEQVRKETAREILKMFDDKNYITEKDLKNAIAEQFGIDIKE